MYIKLIKTFIIFIREIEDKSKVLVINKTGGEKIKTARIK